MRNRWRFFNKTAKSGITMGIGAGMSTWVYFLAYYALFASEEYCRQEAFKDEYQCLHYRYGLYLLPLLIAGGAGIGMVLGMSKIILDGLCGLDASNSLDAPDHQYLTLACGKKA